MPIEKYASAKFLYNFAFCFDFRHYYNITID